MGYFVYNVTTVSNNLTVRDFLIKNNLGKPKIYKLEINKCLYLNGKTVHGDAVMNLNDTLVIDTSILDNDLQSYVPFNKPIDILYEDEYLMVINKPSNTIIYDNNSTTSLANMISNYYLENNEDWKVRPIHRLDKDTTGCILIAKDVITHSRLTEMLENDEIKRYYYAVCYGKMTSRSGEIAFPIGSDRHINGKMVITKNGKNAVTHYKVLESNSNYTVLELLLETGRTHQIRVHLSYIGKPIVGDTLYGSNVTAKRYLLHSQRIEFKHPYKDELVVVKANVPNDMKKYIKKSLQNEDTI